MKRERNILDEKQKYFRRSLRRDNTKAEFVLWQELRGCRRGEKFRRQVGIGQYIVDFYCHELFLVIELDGPVHEYEDARLYDTRRQAWLELKGYTVIRFLNDEVLFEREDVLLNIDEWCYILEEEKLSQKVLSPVRRETERGLGHSK